MVPEVDSFHDSFAHRALRWAISVMLVLGFGACVAEGANNPEDPQLRQGRLAGFGEIAFRVQPAGAAEPTPTELCALLAATDAQRARGLMQVVDMQGYTGMVFRYAQDSQSAFYMKNTPMPLSVAWFGADGKFIKAADMDPCGDQVDCPLFGAGAPFRYALEVPRGQLPALGIGPGSTLILGGPCPG